VAGDRPEDACSAWDRLEAGTGAAVVHAWRLLFLLSVAVGIVASNLRQEASTLQQIRGASDVTLLSDALILPAAVLACLVSIRSLSVSGDVRSNAHQPTSVSPTSDRKR
jgi:hypothetical protein